MTASPLPGVDPLAQQAPSLLPTGRLRAPLLGPPLYRHYWPPVSDHAGVDRDFTKFVDASVEEQRQRLAESRADSEAHGRVLHGYLGSLYADSFGYRDSPVAFAVDDQAELARFRARLQLERELFEHWVDAEPLPELRDQVSVAEYLDDLAADNPGVNHPLFAYLRDHAPREQLELFLQCDLIRNEVVDDEVALLMVGLQGMQKAVAAANLWDECGRGKLENFHTYWLRRLLEASDGWDRLYQYRQQYPWFAKITSNLFTALLTRPSRKQMAYGCFLVFESWVEPHFRAILGGMRRVGLTSDDLTIYFEAHVAIDPRHSRELSDALRVQQPRLDARELGDVVYGAHLAASAGKRQFDHMLDYLILPPVTAHRNDEAFRQ
ncbi:MAG: iron-containing redox enzyme family protein [Gammaproteobacteria bacterium]|nr:iron-containing redox enzyme family protein [Gammaproteobacteria bacterium]